mmetsp:Transcript_16681/g.25905  ORF Transcript_16681/g.25905 Transcript_16681/m.25905 type:complete len:93 (+) Transcript_16681:430-708(+)
MIYEDGLNVSDLSVLLQAAQELGIEGAEDYLRSDKDSDGVKRMAQQASRMGISGVPFFVVQSAQSDEDPITFSGAQPVKTFEKVFKTLTAAA